MRNIVLIAHDIRSTHNIGSVLRTAEGLGINKVYLTGYTPYPMAKNDRRLPHIIRKLESQIHKTALGAENSQDWEHIDDVATLVDDLKDEGYEIVGLEQQKGSTVLSRYEPPNKVALLLGREVEGIDKNLMKQCDEIVEIPMRGKKESFNVVEAATMAMYHLKHYPFA